MVGVNLTDAIAYLINRVIHVISKFFQDTEVADIVQTSLLGTEILYFNKAKAQDNIGLYIFLIATDEYILKVRQL